MSTKVKTCPSCRREFAVRSGNHYFCSAECRQRLTPDLCFMPWDQWKRCYQETYSRLHFPVVCGGCGCFFVVRTDDDDLRQQLVCLPCHRLRRAAANRLQEERAAALRRRPLLPVPGLLAAGLVLMLQHARLRNNLFQ